MACMTLPKMVDSGAMTSPLPGLDMHSRCHERQCCRCCCYHDAIPTLRSSRKAGSACCTLQGHAWQQWLQSLTPVPRGLRSAAALPSLSNFGRQLSRQIDLLVSSQRFILGLADNLVGQRDLDRGPDPRNCCADQPPSDATASATDVLIVLPGNPRLCGPAPNGSVFKMATIDHPYYSDDPVVNLPAC